MYMCSVHVSLVSSGEYSHSHSCTSWLPLLPAGVPPRPTDPTWIPTSYRRRCPCRTQWRTTVTHTPSAPPSAKNPKLSRDTFPVLLSATHTGLESRMCTETKVHLCIAMCIMIVHCLRLSTLAQEITCVIMQTVACKLGFEGINVQMYVHVPICTCVCIHVYTQCMQYMYIIYI